MRRKRDDIYQAVVAEIEKLGGRIDRQRQAQGSHVMVYWSLGERRLQSIISRDAGNWRGIKNALSMVRGKARGTLK